MIFSLLEQVKMNISLINKWTKISGWLLISFFYVYYLDPVKVLQKLIFFKNQFFLCLLSYPVKVLQKPVRIIVYTQNDINMSEKHLKGKKKY